MANEVYELAVALEADGADEVQDDLEATEDQVDQTAQSVGEASEEMGSFSDQWAGALQAATVGLAVAAAGLLAQIPVLGEAMSGLFAIVEAVAFQIDQVLRPVLTPLANKLFEIANAIFEADGAFGKFIGTATLIAGVLAGVAAAVILITAKFLGWSTVLTVFVTAAKVVVGILGAIIGGISLTAAIIALAIAGIIAFAVAWIFNIGNVREKTWDFVDAALDAFGQLKDKTAQLMDALFTFLINNAKRTANIFSQVIQAGVNTALKAIPKELRSKVGLGGGVQISKPFQDVPALGGIGGGGGGGGGAPSADRPERDRPTREEIAVKLDGKRIDEGIKKYRDDDSSRRGRFGPSG